MSLKSAFAAIHGTNAEPELKFAAAMVAAAAEDARAGDCAAYQWIERCSLRWLFAIVPMEDDCQRVQAALLATIPALKCAASPSEMSLHVVQLSLELEALWA